MEKLKKVLAAMLLCVCMVVAAGAGTAKAEEETKVIPAGTYAFKEQLGYMDLISHYDAWYLNYCRLYKADGEPTGYCYYINPTSDNGYYVSIKQIVVTGHSPASGFSVEYYDNSMKWNSKSGLNYGKGENVTRYFVLEQNAEVESAFFDWFVLNVEDVDGLLVDHYDFSEWCADAGLNCVASANESSSVIPFWFNEKYIYIVRKCVTPTQTSGTWLLSMIYYGDDSVHYPYHRQVGDLGYIGLASTSETTQTVTVRNFVYDEDGGGWLLREKSDCELNSATPVTAISNYEMLSDNIVMIYSNCDIYADAAKTSVWFQKSGEFYDVEIKLPEITRAPIGDTTIGGSAEAGSGLDFMITLFSMIWTKICTIEMDVDGYTITLQQIIVYGLLVTIVGGFIVNIIFGRK